jgi:hypothetical protein
MMSAATRLRPSQSSTASTTGIQLVRQWLHGSEFAKTPHHRFQPHQHQGLLDRRNGFIALQGTRTTHHAQQVEQEQRIGQAEIGQISKADQIVVTRAGIPDPPGCQGESASVVRRWTETS